MLALLKQCGVQDIPCSTCQARKFIEKRMCQTVHYNERVVYRYNDRAYVFHYQRIFHCINQLLRNKSLADACVFDYRETQRDGEVSKTNDCVERNFNLTFLLFLAYICRTIRVRLVARHRKNIVS